MTILHIDPHKKDRECWIHRLKVCSPDYVVLEAETGRSGLAIVHSQQIDCVVIELTLPDMSGFEVLVQLVPRVHHPQIAVIVLTRLVLYPMADLALKNGAQAYLSKSKISGADLDRAIRKAIAAISPRKHDHQ